jgi:hypothetical protein
MMPISPVEKKKEVLDSQFYALWRIAPIKTPDPESLAREMPS